MVTVDGIKFIKSPIVTKKYRAIFPDGHTVDFGSKGYQHYFDRIGMYTNLNHYDVDRRIKYIARHSKVKKKDGSYAIEDKRSPAYLSLHYLW